MIKLITTEKLLGKIKIIKEDFASYIDKIYLNNNEITNITELENFKISCEINLEDYENSN